MVKPSNIFSYRTEGHIILMKPRMEHYVLKLYKVYINDDPLVDLGLFYDNVKFGETVFALIVISGERSQDIGPLVYYI